MVLNDGTISRVPDGKRKQLQCRSIFESQRSWQCTAPITMKLPLDELFRMQLYCCNKFSIRSFLTNVLISFLPSPYAEDHCDKSLYLLKAMVCITKYMLLTVLLPMCLARHLSTADCPTTADTFLGDTSSKYGRSGRPPSPLFTPGSAPRPAPARNDVHWFIYSC